MIRDTRYARSKIRAILANHSEAINVGEKEINMKRSFLSRIDNLTISRIILKNVEIKKQEEV